MTRILALDSAGITGFCLGAPGVDVPRFGTRNFFGEGASGEVPGRFRLWLVATIEKAQPTVVTYEAPYVPTGLGRGPPRNAVTVRRLLGLAEIIDATCYEHRIDCYQMTASEVCAYLTGKSNWGGRDKKKAATVAAARAWGWAVENDDEADACAIWAFTEKYLDPVAAAQRRARLGLELHLHPEKDDAPRLVVAGRRGVGPKRRKGISSNGKRIKNNSDTSELQFASG